MADAPREAWITGIGIVSSLEVAARLINAEGLGKILVHHVAEPIRPQKVPIAIELASEAPGF